MLKLHFPLLDVKSKTNMILFCVVYIFHTYDKITTIDYSTCICKLAHDIYVHSNVLLNFNVSYATIINQVFNST
jgi:hypothetical protein